MSDRIQNGSSGTGATSSTRATAGGTGPTHSAATAVSPIATSTTPEELSQNPDAINEENLKRELQEIINANGDLEANKFGKIYSSLQDNGPLPPTKVLAILVYFLSNKSMVLTDETILSEVKQADNNFKDLNPKKGVNLLGLLQSQLSINRINPETLNEIKKVQNPVVIALNCMPLITNKNIALVVKIDDFVELLNYLKKVINDNETSAGS